MPLLHPAQQTIKTEATRFNIVCCGRRFGKNVVGHELAIRAALQGKPIAWVAPTYPELDEDFTELYGKLYSVITAKNESKMRLDIQSGGFIKFWSLDGKQSMRGKHYARVIINEAAKISRLETEWNEVIRATLADLKGDAFFLSTPKGLNYFFTLYQRAKIEQDWRRWHYTTYDNPFIERDEIEAMRHDMPERVFKQEILAEFITDGSYFQDVDKCAVIDAPDTIDQHRGHYLVAGVDWAKSNDWTVITIGCRNCNRVVDWQRFNQIDYRLQRERLITMHRKWSVSYWLVESNSIGEPNIEELQYSGLPVVGFQMTATTKPPLIEDLNRTFVMDGFQVPREFGDELRAYEIISSSGRTRFGAPAGLHDDTVISLALCNRAKGTTRSVIAFGG